MEAYDLYQRGMSFLKAGHPAQAVLLLRRAARLEPGKNSIREGLARAHYALGEFERAAEVFGQIVASVPVNDYAHFGLGCALAKLGRGEEARAHLRLALAMAPHREEYRERLSALEALAE